MLLAENKILTDLYKENIKTESDKPVANTTFGEDVFGLIRIVFYFLAKCTYKYSQVLSLHL